jgi:nucleoside-diphosphate-sugar epimerase
MAERKDMVIVTGSTGFIGSALMNKFAGRFSLVGLDRAATRQPPRTAECICIDLTSKEAVVAALQRVRTAYGARIAR